MKKNNERTTRGFQPQYRAEVTPNISTAESPGRWPQLYELSELIIFRI